MSITQSVKKIFSSIKSSMSQLRSGSEAPAESMPPSSPSIDDSESQRIAAPVVAEAEQNRNQFLMQWQNVVMAFCFTSALEIAILFAQTQSQLPLSFHLLSFGILLIFLSLFVANLIGHHFTTTTQVLEIVAVILVTTTFVFTIAIPFPLGLKCATWVVYAISLFTVFMCQYFF